MSHVYERAEHLRSTAHLWTPIAQRTDDKAKNLRRPFGYSKSPQPISQPGNQLWLDALELSVDLSASRTAGGANPQVEIVGAKTGAGQPVWIFPKTDTIAAGSYKVFE